MTPQSTPPIPTEASGRSVQDYIDETPVWADATPVRHAPITNMQWFIWWLAAAGKFFEGMVVFTTGVALPLMAKESLPWARPRRALSPPPRYSAS
jgi:putative MFS transporter